MNRPTDDEFANPSAHAAFDLPGVGLGHVVTDMMHNHCSGISAAACGAVLWSLVYDKSWNVPGRRIADRLQRVWQDIQSVYREFITPNRLPKLTLHMFTDPTRPY